MERIDVFNTYIENLIKDPETVISIKNGSFNEVLNKAIKHSARLIVKKKKSYDYDIIITNAEGVLERLKYNQVNGLYKDYETWYLTYFFTNKKCT